MGQHSDFLYLFRALCYRHRVIMRPGLIRRARLFPWIWPLEISSILPSTITSLSLVLRIRWVTVSLLKHPKIRVSFGRAVR